MRHIKGFMLIWSIQNFNNKILESRGAVMTDVELTDKIKNCPSDGISAAIELYGGAVLKICNDILKGYQSEDVEEAVSDVFVALWKSVGEKRYNGQTPVKYYIYGIARKTALGKRREMTKAVKTDVIDEVDIDSGENVEERIIEKSQKDIIEGLILSMKSPDREVFKYRYYEQMQVKEIAQKLIISPKKVENILFRGKNNLKKQLKLLGF